MSAGHDYSKFAGTCKEACEAVKSQQPDLEMIRGYYHCPMWGKREHWWLRDALGQITDPTVKQFPTCGVGAEYEEFDGTCECEQCGKQITEEVATTYGNYAFCSTPCLKRCVGL